MYYQAVSVTLTLRVMRERQTPKKLKLIKCFSCSRWRLWYLPVWKNKLKLNRQKWGKKEKSLDPSKTRESLCLLFLYSLLLCLWKVNKRQMSRFHSLGDGFLTDSMAVKDAQQRAGVFINSGLAAVTVPLLHHSSEPALLREALPRLLSHWLMLLISWQTPRDGGSGAGVRTVGSYHVFGSGPVRFQTIGSA